MPHSPGLAAEQQLAGILLQPHAGLAALARNRPRIRIPAEEDGASGGIGADGSQELPCGYCTRCV